MLTHTKVIVLENCIHEHKSNIQNDDNIVSINKVEI